MYAELCDYNATPAGRSPSSARASVSHELRGGADQFGGIGSGRRRMERPSERTKPASAGCGVGVPGADSLTMLLASTMPPSCGRRARRGAMP